MISKTLIRLAHICHEYDMAGRFHDSDILTQVLLRLAQSETDTQNNGDQNSATQRWWNGFKQVGTGIADDVRSVGTAVAAPFEAEGAAAKAAWEQGIVNAPSAAAQSWDQSNSRFNQQAHQALSNVEQGGAAAAGPYGTGLPGAMASDAVSNLGNAANHAAQGYVNNAVTQQDEARQQANMTQWLQQAIQAHKTNSANGGGWAVINNAVQYGQLSPGNQSKLKQQFAVAAAGL